MLVRDGSPCVHIVKHLGEYQGLENGTLDRQGDALFGEKGTCKLTVLLLGS